MNPLDRVMHHADNLAAIADEVGQAMRPFGWVAVAGGREILLQHGEPDVDVVKVAVRTAQRLGQRAVAVGYGWSAEWHFPDGSDVEGIGVAAAGATVESKVRVLNGPWVPDFGGHWAGRAVVEPLAEWRYQAHCADGRPVASVIHAARQSTPGLLVGVLGERPRP